MELHQKGWLKVYAQYLVDHQIFFEVNKPLQTEHLYHYLYHIFRKTGVLYGTLQHFSPEFSVFAKNELHQKLKNHPEKNKLILLDLYLFYIKNKYPDKQETEGAVSKEIFKIIEDIGLYFYTIYPDIEKPAVMSFLKTEEILEKKIAIKNSFLSYSQNGLLFLDLYFFSLSYEMDITELIDLRKKTIQNLYDLIQYFKHLNPSKEKDKIIDKTFLQVFLQSTGNIDLDTKKNQSTQHLENIDLSFESKHWMLKKYFLEKIIYIDLLDVNRSLDVPELQKLLHQLGLSILDYQESVTYLQHFILSNPDQLGEKSPNLFKKIYNHFSNSIKKEYYTHKKNILREITESGELAELLKKSATTELSEEEKTKVKKQLWDILKTIPAFAIFMLPGGSIILPILLKILPKELLLPSSYYDEDQEPIKIE